MTPTRDRAREIIQRMKALSDEMHTLEMEYGLPARVPAYADTAASCIWQIACYVGLAYDINPHTATDGYPTAEVISDEQ